MPKARHTNASSKKSEIVSGRPEVTELMMNNVTIDKLKFDIKLGTCHTLGDTMQTFHLHRLPPSLKRDQAAVAP